MVRRVGLTTDFESVRSALDAVTVVGDTSLRDALFLALHTAAPEATRPLLLIFTDGADTSSLLLADEVPESVRDAKLVIHAVSFGYQPFSNRPRTKQADAFGQRRPIEICRNSSVEPFATCETATFWPIRLTASVAREGTPWAST
jgi:hypothetical protein